MHLPTQVQIRCLLFIVNLILKIFPLKTILDCMSKYSNRECIEDIHLCLSIVQRVNKASRESLVPYTCLTRSITSAVLCWKRNLKINFIIGIREIPFKSHAWVSYGRFPLSENMVNIMQYKELVKI